MLPLLAHRHGADGAVAEVLAFDSDGVIETGAVVLPGDSGSKFYQFCISEALAQACEECIGNFDWSTGHGVGVLEDKPFQVREVETGPVVVQVGNLLTGDPAFSADGRADVNSKRTAHKGCDAKFGKTLQFGIDQLAAHLRLLHLEISPEDFGVMRSYLNGHDDPAETPASQKVYEPYEQAAKWAAHVDGRTRNACHRRSYDF